MSEKVRLSKLLSQKGICSRREADEWISKGWVYVDGCRVDQLGTKVDPSVHVKLAPQAQKKQDSKVTILINKPVGYVSSQPEKNYRAAVELIRAETQSKDYPSLPFQLKHLKGLAPAGRLDIDSKGLLVLTQDGVMAKNLIDSSSSVEKEYIVRVQGEITDSVLNLLCHGLELDQKKLKPARVKMIKEQTLQFILTEGKKRQIRRMCALVGLKVLSLKRVRIGKVQLGRLKEGQWRYLKMNESF